MARISQNAPPSGPRKALAVVVFLGVTICVGMWGLNLTLQDPQDTPVIRADGGPYKQRPADPRGIDVPYQDSELYETINPEEKREVITLAPDQGSQDGDIWTEEPSPWAAAATDLDTVEVNEVPTVAPVTESAPAPAVQEPVQEIASVPEQILQSLKKRQPYQVQLGALPSEQQVREEWTRMRRAYGEHLSGLTLEVQPAGNTGLFRLRAGSFASYGEASDVCLRLARYKQDCIVVTQ